MLFTTKGKLAEFTKSNVILFFLDSEKKRILGQEN